MHWLVLAGLACSTAEKPELPTPRKTPAMAPSSRTTPSAGIRGPDPLTVSPYGQVAEPPCEDCARCEVTRVTASSNRASTERERFHPANLLDGNPSSAWCDVPSDGAPSTVTFAIPDGCRVHGLSVVSGHIGDRVRLEQNGRASGISLTAGRLRGDAAIDDPLGTKLNLKQLLDRPATVFVGWTAYDVDTLMVTFREVHPGSVNPGVCLSELRPVLVPADD